jgi:hypothetical protein
MKQFASSDKKLNAHIFGDIPLKLIDFSSPEVYKMIRGPKRPEGKKGVYKYQLEKLRIMLHFYNQDDFDEIKFFRLNGDQILQFLDCENFIGPNSVARKEKVIEAIKFLQKSRDLNLYKRPEIINAVR